MKDEIVGVYGDASPWLRTAWEHMKQNGKVFRIVETGLGRASVLGICGIDASGLWVCRVASTQIRDSAFYFVPDQLPGLLIHEMAHYFDRSSDLSGDSTALAGFRLYLESLPKRALSTCRVSELYADVFLLSVLPTVSTAYWGLLHRLQ